MQRRLYIICFLAGLVGAFAGYFLADWVDFHIATWSTRQPNEAEHSP